MADLLSQSYVFDPRPNYPHLITAKRYWKSIPTSQVLKDPDAFTLIFAHGTGFHKEHFEATLEDLYKCVQNHPGHSSIKIREAWTIDCPNHGEAAFLNEKSLQWGYETVCTYNRKQVPLFS